VQVHTLHGSGLGQFDLSSILSSVGTALTPELQQEAEQIIVPIIAPYAIALVALSAAGLLFGVTAYSQVRKLRRQLKKSAITTKPAAALAPTVPA
jgi:hypothetical protein